MSRGIAESAANIQAVDPLEDKEQEGTPCPKCGKPIVWTRFCIHCGFDTQPPTPVSVSTKWLIAFVALVLLCCGPCTVWYMSPMLFP